MRLFSKLFRPVSISTDLTLDEAVKVMSGLVAPPDTLRALQRRVQHGGMYVGKVSEKGFAIHRFLPRRGIDAVVRGKFITGDSGILINIHITPEWFMVAPASGMLMFLIGGPIVIAFDEKYGELGFLMIAAGFGLATLFYHVFDAEARRAEELVKHLFQSPQHHSS